VNVEAFENLKRVLRSVRPEELDMTNWRYCAIGHASRDAWFMKRALARSFSSAEKVFEVRRRDSVALFTIRAGRTPEQVIAAIDALIESAASEQHVRRQAIIDQLLAAALKVERGARVAARALLAAFGI